MTDALRRLLREPLGALGLGLVVVIVASAVFADALAAYQPTQLDIRNRRRGRRRSTGSAPTISAATPSRASSTSDESP